MTLNIQPAKFPLLQKVAQSVLHTAGGIKLQLQNMRHHEQ